MKKLFYFLATAVALFAISSCEEKPEDNTPTIPEQIEVTLTNLVKGDVETGDVNKLPVSASADGVELQLTFYSDKVYLAAGTYTVGTAAGNYEGKIKAKDVELASIKSGSITVADDGNDGYTLTGTLRLNNEVETIAKLNATGTLAYELPTEYYYTVTKGSGSNVYKVYDLQSHQIAAAEVVGAEEGAFDVAEGKLVPGNVNDGTWVWIDGFGTEVYLHGKVTVSTSHGKKVFKFEGNHERTFSNCELKADLTPVPIRGATEADDMFSMSIVKFSVVASPVVENMFEVTAKLFWADGREFLTMTVLTSNETFPFSDQGGKPSRIVTYDEYKAYDASLYSSTGGRIAPVGTCFYMVNGVKTGVDVSAVSGLFALINYKEDAEKGVKYALVTYLDAKYNVPESLLSVLVGDDLNTKVYNCLGLYLD